MTEWFETWFNTDEYLNVYRKRNETEAAGHVSFILQNLKIQPPASILDMACGAGRHSLIFAKMGYKVTAVDLSDKLLCTAQTQARLAGVDIEFIKSDLRDIRLDKKFDIIINLFTSFGYFEDDNENYKIFDIALKHLNYNGKFVIDFFNKNYLLNNLKECSEEDFSGTKVLQQRKILNNRIVKKIHISSGSETKTYFESVRIFSPGELIEALNDRGLFVDRVYGDFGGNKFDPEKSERIVIFAVK